MAKKLTSENVYDSYSKSIKVSCTIPYPGFEAPAIRAATFNILHII